MQLRRRGVSLLAGLREREDVFVHLDIGRVQELGVAQQAVQFAAEVLELRVARLGRRHEGGHDGVLGLPLPTCGASRFRARTGRPQPAVFF